TFPEYFEVEYIPGKKFALQDGKFLEGTFDAVIGARVARAYGWKVGHKFPIAHGGNLGDIHEEKFTIAGILAPTGLPIDRGVFIHYDGFYEIPGHGMTKQEAAAEAGARGGAEGGEIIVPDAGTGAGEAEPGARSA